MESPDVGCYTRWLIALELINYPLESIQSNFELFHLGTEADPAVILVSALCAAIAWIHVEKDTWDNDDLFFETFAKEGHSIIERFWQPGKIGPNIKCAGRFGFDV